MQIKYQHRWHYFAAILGITLWLIWTHIILPANQELLKLKTAESELSDNLSKIKQFLNRSEMTGIPGRSMTVSIDALYKIANQFGVTLQTMELNVDQLGLDTPLDIIHLSVVGEFPALINFLLSIEKQGTIADFSYQVKNDHRHHVDLNVLLQRQESSSIQLSPHHLHNPFCDTPYHLRSDYDRGELLKTPIHQIKLIGYLQQGSTILGIVSLPSGANYQISKGTLLGLEKSKVVDIKHDHFVLEDASRKMK